jgi:hypothetical protein
LAGWITDIRAKEKHLILVGVAAMFWSIWLCRNDISFDKKIHGFFGTSHLQMHLLVSLLEIIMKGTPQEGGGTNMSHFRSDRHERLCQEWMAVA